MSLYTRYKPEISNAHVLHAIELIFYTNKNNIKKNYNFNIRFFSVTDENFFTKLLKCLQLCIRGITMTISILPIPRTRNLYS